MVIFWDFSGFFVLSLCFKRSGSKVGIVFSMRGAFVTAIYASISYVGVRHLSLWKRPQNVVWMRRWKQDSVDAHQRCSGAADRSLRKGTVVSIKATTGWSRRQRHAASWVGPGNWCRGVHRRAQCPGGKAGAERGSARRTGMHKTKLE